MKNRRHHTINQKIPFRAAMGKLLFLSCLLSSGIAFAQPGGVSAFSFLEIPASARQSALGGGLLTTYDLDPGILVFDPAQLRPGMHNRSMVTYVDYFAGISGGMIGHARTIGRQPYYAAVQYLNYGTFISADETGIQGNEFKAGDYAFTLGTARPLIDSVFIIGVNLKGIYSSLESYNSWGAGMDVSIGYYNRRLDLGASLVASNIGYQFDPYTEDQRYPLPLNIKAGISKKLERAPLRLLLTYNYLQRFNMTYYDSTNVVRVNSLTGEEQEIKPPGVFEHFARHLILGAEITPVKAFAVRIGYNYQRRREMVVETRPALAGFSWGLGLNLNRFSLNYSRSSYHLAGGVNHLTLVLGLRGGKSG